MSGFAIRPERAGDETAIGAVTTRAFAEAEHSDGTEAAITESLRHGGDLALSLVAEKNGEIIGHIAFSPVTTSDGSTGWYGLGPISVVPEHQNEGIGGAMIEHGIALLSEMDAQGIVLLGDPAYYARFGFTHDPALDYPGPPPEYFQRLVLAGEPATGIVTYAPAFG